MHGSFELRYSEFRLHLIALMDTELRLMEKMILTGTSKTNPFAFKFNDETAAATTTHLH